MVATSGEEDVGVLEDGTAVGELGGGGVAELDTVGDFAAAFAKVLRALTVIFLFLG